VVVNVVDISRILAFKAEYDPAVAAYADRVVPRPVALERVQAQAGQIHILWAGRRMEAGQDQPQTPGMFRTDSPDRAFSEEGRQSFVAERTYHAWTTELLNCSLVFLITRVPT
jgi:hypothetical protein